MGDLNRALGVHGGGYFFTDKDGKEWHFSPCAQKFKAGFEAWLEGRARKDAAAWKEILSPEDFQKRVTDVGDKIAAGTYGWQGQIWAEAVTNAIGLSYLYFLLAQQHHEDVTLEDTFHLVVENQDGVSALLKEILDSGKAGNPQKPATTPPATA